MHLRQMVAPHRKLLNELEALRCRGAFFVSADFDFARERCAKDLARGDAIAFSMALSWTDVSKRL